MNEFWLAFYKVFFFFLPLTPLKWVHFASFFTLNFLLCADPCLHSGSFHLIHLMFDDYVLYLLESLHCQERANDLMRSMKGDGSAGENDRTAAVSTVIPLILFNIYE